VRTETRKGFIMILEGNGAGEEIEILYFPPEYSMEKSNTFAEMAIPGLESPYIQFVKGNAASITLEVFYDTYEKNIDVRTVTDKLTDLMNIDPKLHAPRPLQFIWGMKSRDPFNCVLEKVTKKFTMFSTDGIPVRARLSITLKEFKKELNDREKSTQSPDKSKVYLVKQGDSLWEIAYREYGDPSEWRPIAEINHILNPRFLRPGMNLIVPPLE
jgi:hypothetical protein